MSEDGDRVNLWRYGTAGVEFIVTFGLLLGAGLLVDRWLESLPVFTLAGALAGFGGGLWRLIQVGRQAGRRSGDKGPRKAKDSRPPDAKPEA